MAIERTFEDKQSVLNPMSKIHSGYMLSDFGLGTFEYNLEVLLRSKDDSVMRKVANGETTYSTVLQEVVLLDAVPSKNLLIHLIDKKFTKPEVRLVKNEFLLRTIVDELNSLQLYKDDYVINKYSNLEIWRDKPVSNDNLIILIDFSKKSSERMGVYNHIKTKVHYADKFFTYVLNFKKLIAKYGDSLR